MNTSRRQFLAFGAWMAGEAAVGRGLAKPLGIPIGIQPYTVRNELPKDPEGTLKQLARMGYEAIEASAPFYGRQAAETHKLMHSLGLVIPSGHYPNPKNDADWDRSIEQAKILGSKFMITNAPREWHGSLDGWKRAADLFNRLGAQTKKAGIALAYHNHHFEYKVFDGVMGYDQFLKSTDPGLVKMQMDIFWTTYAGQDPLAYFDKYPGRFPVWHIKDLKKGFPPSTDQVKGNPFTEIGAGTINWKRIFGGARKAGLRYYFVEQDQSDREPLESARISCEFLKKFNA